MKKIHQIYISDSSNLELPEYIQTQVDKVKQLYSDYEYILWDNTSIREFIISNFSQEILSVYDDLKPYAFKSDLARYCILYKLGGYYFDISISPEIKFEPKKSTMFVGIKNAIETNNLDIIENNVLFFPSSNDPFLKNAIDRILNNVKWLNYGEHPLDITGPTMLARLDHGNIDKGYVRQDSGRKLSFYNNELIYKHKPKQYQANLSKLGCIGVNNYEKMWFNGDVFNIRFSYVMITNGKKNNITKMSVRSILDNATDNDELIIIGNTEFLKNYNNKNITLVPSKDALVGKISSLRNNGNKLAKNNVIINTDDDIIFSSNFQSNLYNYISANYRTFDTLNTKIVLPNGGRWWDKAIYLSKNNTILISYDHSYDDRLFYSGSLLIWKKQLALKIPFDENRLYYDPIKDNEDIKLSSDLKRSGYKIKIDLNNFVVHFDNSYITYTDDLGNLTVAKKNNQTNIVIEEGMKPIINSVIKKYSK